jgi:hypothetical protein
VGVRIEFDFLSRRGHRRPENFIRLELRPQKAATAGQNSSDKAHMEATAQIAHADKRSGFGEFAARLAAGASAVLVLVLLILKWYEAHYELNIPGLDVSALGGEAAKEITATAWQVSLIGKLVVVLALVALAVAAVYLLVPKVKLPFSVPLALFALGAAMAGLIVLTMFTDPKFAPEPEAFVPGYDNVKFIYKSETQIGIYVSLGLAGLVAFAGALIGLGSRRHAR